MTKGFENQPWRLAHSLRVLREQLDDAAPERSKISDGSIGDARHQSRRSDHNPWIKVVEKGHVMSVVSAIDITHDPEGGCDCRILANLLMADRRVKYLIFNRKIWNPTINQAWRRYKGANPHTEHLHVSVMPDFGFLDNTDPWPIDELAKYHAGADKKPW